jgi:hypothetical protein
MGMSADLGELMRSYGLDGNVPVYRSPQTFPGILEQTQPAQGNLAGQASGNPYGQLSGMPTIRPYPFQDPRFSLTPLSNKAPNVPRALSLTPLSNKAPKVPRLSPPIKLSNKTSARASRQGLPVTSRGPARTTRFDLPNPGQWR